MITPRENTEMWVKFANLCRKSGRLGLADKTLNSLLGDDRTSMGAPVRVIPSLDSLQVTRLILLFFFR